MFSHDMFMSFPVSTYYIYMYYALRYDAMYMSGGCDMFMVVKYIGYGIDIC